MAADSTLVNAAFKLGQTEAGANVPNMAPLMQAQVGISKGYTKMAMGAMDGYQKKKEIQRVGKAKQLGKFESVFTDALTKLYEQKEPLPQPFIDAVTDEVEKLQEEFEGVNTYGKGDTSENNRERARIMGELKRKVTEITNFRAGLMQFGIDRENGLLNEALIQENDILPAQQVLDLRNFQKNYDLGNLSVGYGEDGKIQVISRNHYSDANGSWGEDVVVTMESLNKSFPPINEKQDADILSMQTESATTGNVDGLKTNATKSYDRDQRYSEYLNSLDTKDSISNIVARKIKGVGGMQPSFKDALLSDINIPLNVLDNMFYDDDGERVEVGLLFKDLDLDGVDGITSKDHALAEKIGGEALISFEANLDAMMDVITNVNNPAFDTQTTANLLADYLTSMDEQKYNDSFDKAVKSKGGGKSATGSQIIYGGSNLGEKSFVVQDDILDKAMNNEPIISWGGERFDPDPKNPGNYILEGTEESKPIDGILRGKYFGMNERINSRKLEYPTGLPNVNTKVPEKAEEEVIPNSADFAATANPKKILASWKKRYEGKGFKYDTSVGGTVVTITADNGETHVAKLSTFRGNRNDQARALNEFIEKNKI